MTALRPRRGRPSAEEEGRLAGMTRVCRIRFEETRSAERRSVYPTVCHPA